MIKKLFCFIFLLFTACGFSQVKYSLGVGVNSSLFVLQVPSHEAAPGFPVSPNITARYRKHEILIGSDIYFTHSKAKVFGAQCSYHFYPSKKVESGLTIILISGYNTRSLK